MIKNLILVAIEISIMAVMSFATSVEFNDMKADDMMLSEEQSICESEGTFYMDSNKDGVHDIDCVCQTCSFEKEYYMEIYGTDTVLKIGQTMTITDIDTLDGLTVVFLSKNN